MPVFRLLSAIVLAVTCLSCVNVSAATIGMVYSTRYRTIAPTITAGAPGFVQSNWNISRAEAGDQAPGATIPVLIDSLGNPTGVSLSSFTLAVNNSYVQSYGSAAANDDEILMENFADQDPTLVFNGLNSFAPNGYSVVVYYGNNENAGVSSLLTVNGVSESIRMADNIRILGGYVQDIPGLDNANRSNYVVLNDFTQDTLTIFLDSSQNDGLTAVQIVPNAITAPSVPEPGSIALVGVALLGGAAYRLRRRGN